MYNSTKDLYQSRLGRYVSIGTTKAIMETAKMKMKILALGNTDHKKGL